MGELQHAGLVVGSHPEAPSHHSLRDEGEVVVDHGGGPVDEFGGLPLHLLGGVASQDKQGRTGGAGHVNSSSRQHGPGTSRPRREAS